MLSRQHDSGPLQERKLRKKKYFLISWIIFTAFYFTAAYNKPFHVDEFYSWVYAERCTFKEIILLTDFDRRGELLKKRLVELCKNDGIEVNLSFRKELRRLTGLNTIEELVSKYEELLERENKKYKGEFYGNNLYRYSEIRSSCKSGNRRDS